MRDRCAQLPKATLTIGNLDAEQVLVVAVERIAFQIFVGPISKGHGGTRQNVFYPSVQAGVFILCRAQGGFNCGQDRANARPVSFSVALGRTGFKVVIAQVGSKIILCAGPQKKLKH